MTNTFKKSLLFFTACLMASFAFAETAIFEGNNLNVSGGAKTVGSITLSVPSSNGMTWSSSMLYASGSGKIFHLEASSGATISQVLITTNSTSNRYQASNITGCSSCTRNDKVYTCDFSTPQASIDLKNNGGGVGITKLEVTYSGGSGGGGGSTTPTVSSVVIDPTSATLEPNDTKQLSVTVTVSPDNADNKKVTWSSDKTGVATVDENGLVTAVAQGTATITATSTIDNTKKGTCTITVNPPAQQIPATGVLLNKTSTTIGVGATETLTVSFSPAGANTGKEVTWASDNAAVTVDNNGTIKGVTAGGSANVTVSLNSDPTKKATCAVTVKEAAPIPQTNLTCHEPGIYEEKTVAGGYGAKLSAFSGREYEVYYASFLESGALSVTTTPAQKSEGITTSLSDYNCKAKDGWFEMKTSTSKSNYSLGAKDEFKAGEAAIHKLLNNAYYKMHIKGFDQFSFYGKDNSTTISEETSKNKRFQVYIDDVLQPENPVNAATIRRYDISTGEHVIEVRGIGASNNEFYGFSLREAQVPHIKYLKGNDSTQVILQTQAPKSVYYFTKYNDKGETKLEWVGAEATGITLEKAASSTIGDTLVLGGIANCPVGEYKFNVVTYMNGVETSRVDGGKFKVVTEIKAASDTIVDAFQNEEMEEISFRYYAIDASGITLTWQNNNAPAGISGNDKGNNTYVIGGTTTAAAGKYKYTITINGSSTVITGYVEVFPSDLGADPVLYLYQTKSPQRGYDKDGIYEYLKGKNVNLQPRPAISKLRTEEQYGKFKWILISEDVNADNEEVLAIARGEAKLPVLNLKGFTYAEGRLGWGEPDNGSLDTITNNGQYIYVQYPEHPIFAGFNAQRGSKIKIFDKLEQNGVMPINIDDYPESYCLATAYTRNIDDYFKDGELQTIIHEIPASERGGKKYICMPLSTSSSKKLSSDGKKLIKAIADYLLSSEQPSIILPTLEMESFIVNGLVAKIDQNNNRVDLEIDLDQHPEVDLKAVAPKVTVVDPLTHVTPASGTAVDFQYSLYMPVDYVVTDYINRRVYEVVIRAKKSQGIDEVYNVGEWVNVYDIFGRKVATTNENIYLMELPRGMYIVVTENGNTLKITK